MMKSTTSDKIMASQDSFLPSRIKMIHYRREKVNDIIYVKHSLSVQTDIIVVVKTAFACAVFVAVHQWYDIYRIVVIKEYVFVCLSCDFTYNGFVIRYIKRCCLSSVCDKLSRILNFL